MAGTIVWDFPTTAERAGYCDGYVDDAQCMTHPGRKDPRDGGLYCEDHANAMQRHGARGRHLRTVA